MDLRRLRSRDRRLGGAIGLTLVRQDPVRHPGHCPPGNQPALIGLLIDLLQKANVTLLGLRNEAAVAALVFARNLPGRPIPDALIVATALDHGALPLTTFDADMSRYGIDVAAP